MKSALVMLVLAASNATACALQFEEGWIPPSPPAAPMAAGYGKLRNTGKAVLTVTAASSPAFGSVEMHETTLVGNSDGRLLS